MAAARTPKGLANASNRCKCTIKWTLFHNLQEANQYLGRLTCCPFLALHYLHGQAAKSVRLYSDGGDAVASFITAVFDGQGHISNAATDDMTQPEVEAILASWAASSAGVSMHDFDA